MAMSPTSIDKTAIFVVADAVVAHCKRHSICSAEEVEIVAGSATSFYRRGAHSKAHLQAVLNAQAIILRANMI